MRGYGGGDSQHNKCKRAYLAVVSGITNKIQATAGEI